MTIPLASVPRAPRRPEPTERPRPSYGRFQVLPQTGLPFEIDAEPAVAAMLDRLISAGGAGLAFITDLQEADKNLITKARRLGVQIDTSREPRVDGGRGHIARYRLMCNLARCRTHPTD